MIFRRSRAAKTVVEPPATFDVDPAVLETISSSGLFDEQWYEFNNPDTRGFRGGAIAHFYQYGMKERRDPGPNFSTAAYLNKYPEAAKDEISLFLHAVSNSGDGREESWIPRDNETLEYLLERSGLFDADWYVKFNDDVAKSKSTPIEHFVTLGSFEFRDPGPDFDSESYAERHPDYLELCRTPIEHYLRIGRHRGFAAKELPRYQIWINAFDTLTPADLACIGENARESSLSPVVIVYLLSTAGCAHLDRILSSVETQVGVDWSVRFIRAGSLSDEAWSTFRETCRTRPRLACVPADEASLNLADGSTVLLCGDASLIRPHAAYVFAQGLARSQREAAYADHDHVDADGRRTRPVFKPAMSPEFMRQVRYAGPLAAVILNERTRALVTAAVAVAVRDGADIGWASLLMDLGPERVQRIPFVLFHLHGEDDGTTRIFYEPVRDGARIPPCPDIPDEDATAPRVQILIPTRDRKVLLENCIESILSKTRYPRSRFGIIVIDNESVEDATLAYFAKLRDIPGVTVLSSPGAFNFSKICNDGAAAAEADILVFLNNDTTVNQENWLGKLVEHARKPEVGVVGAQLLYPDDTVQHAGVILGIQGVGAHRLVGMDSQVARAIDTTRDMVAVTGACLAIRKDVFRQVGGFDTALRVAFNDVKLCASVFEAGYRNIYVGEPLLQHHESQSRGFDDSPQKNRRNRREAIYVRERFARLFQDDPSYTPNLSLQKIGALAFPPRVVRPWRRATGDKKRLLLLSRAHGLGHGVATVLAQQAFFMRDRGWDVFVGGPSTYRDITYDGCRRVDFSSPSAAASFAVAEGMDCVVAHTPPFFSLSRLIGSRPLFYVMDHGEPPPGLFPDRDEREATDWEKRFCAPLSARYFTISQAVYDQQFRADAIVLRNGNSHLAAWSDTWRSRRPALRRKYGFEGRFVVLNVCRFSRGERYYKGIDRYIDVNADCTFSYPALGRDAVFVLAGRGEPEDVDYVRQGGVEVHPNISDAEMIELYVASDLYLNLSEWEGYNLGIGQALAMGLDVIASDIAAHHEFGVELHDTLPKICAAVHRRYEAWASDAPQRRARIDDWDTPLSKFAALLESDCAQDASLGWF